jgi:hypothetical protein
MLERDRRRREQARYAARYARNEARERQDKYTECPNHGKTPATSLTLKAIPKNGYVELNCYEPECMGEWHTQTHLVHP